MLSTAHAVFSPEGKACLVCSTDNRIKLWDVGSKREARNYIEKRHLAHGYTCRAWSLSNGKKDAGTSGNLGLFAVGTSEGTIIIWDLMRGVVKKELSSSEQGNPSPTDIVFSNDAKSIYVASQLNHIKVYDIESGEIIRSLKTGKKSVGKLCHNPRADVLAMGSSSVKLLDVESEEKRKLSSHFSSHVRCMSFTNCGKYLICSGESSEVVVFDVQASTASDDPVCTIATQAVPKSIRCRSFNKVAIDIIIGYDGCNGCMVRTHIDNEYEVDITEISTKTEILAGSFSESPDSAIIICGSTTKPKFHRIIFLNAEGVLVEELSTIKKAEAATISIEQDGDDRDGSNNGIGSSSVPGPEKLGSVKRPLTGDESQNGTSINANSRKMSKTDELTLEERLESMSSQMYNLEEGMGGSGEDNSDLTSLPTPTSDSLVTLIDQALQSGDDSLLEQCLACNDMDVIDGTARVLKTHRVVTFMKKLVAKFEKRPSRGILLTRWLSCILRHHTSFLISVPDLSEQLAGLSQMLEQRLASYSRLASLSGRLDLLMSQVAGTGGSGRGNQPIKPLHSYTEE